MVTIQFLLNKFWDSDIWLPPNITWADLQSSDEIEYTNHKHLLYPIPMAILLILIRYCFEKYCLLPIGMAFGIKRRKPHIVHNEILERAFKPNVKKKHRDIVGLAKQLDWTEREVERWLRLRRVQDKQSTLVKFLESGWRFTYYASSFSFGLYVLWDKPWLWNIDSCWQNYPHQGVTSDVWWYYMTSAAFYWSLMASQFYDVRRKDFWQMFAHHLLTLFLLSFSWVCNFHRIGSFTILLHDFADIFLEFAKMAKYAKYQKVCDSVSAVFVVCWLSTRTGIFPFLLYNTTVRGPTVAGVPIFPAYFIFNTLLFFLLGLHLFWTYLILKLVKSSLSTGQVERDQRSSSNEFSDFSDNSALASGEPYSTSSRKNSKSSRKNSTSSRKN